jgi:hypothetical protein
MDNKYTWFQDQESIHVHFKINEEDEKKLVKYKIVNKHLSIVYNGEVIVEGEMYDYIERGSDGFLINGDTVELFFNKIRQESWPWLVEGSTLDNWAEQNAEKDHEISKILEEAGHNTD